MNEDDRIRNTVDEDRAIESAVLGQVLALHPTAITLDELAREMGGGNVFADGDAMERAVRDLAASGLVHHSGPFVLPTRAALRFQELTGE